MKIFSTRLPDDIIKWLKLRAIKTNKTIQEFLLEIIQKEKNNN